ncbi:MAG TPA: hypothetical protein VFH73_08940 [Polyangia bacterium]|jgi:hypothetical protein|nr:hypothetical protein [Polyangia bacterium]
MNAAGRVPCRCGATLILDPPGERRSHTSPDLTNADILSLGYGIRVERRAGAFDSAHNGLRNGLGMETRGDTVPDPVRARRPALLWPALGAAWDLRLVLPAMMLNLVALSLRWPIRWFLPAGPFTRLLELSVALIAFAVVAAISTATVANALHDVIVERRPLSFGASLRGLLARRRPLLRASIRESLVLAMVAVFALISVASLIAIAQRGELAALFSQASAPVQALGLLAAAGALWAGMGALLAHAAVTPHAGVQLGVQIQLEARRIWGPRGLVPGRTLAPAAVCAALLAIALSAAVLFALAAWGALAAAMGPDGTGGSVPAFGHDVLWALAGGVWTGFVGITGLLGGYAVGSGAASEPVRAPDIITGTQQHLEPIDDGRISGGTATGSDLSE